MSDPEFHSSDESNNDGRTLSRHVSKDSVAAASKITETTQLLLGETIKDSEARRVITGMKVASALGIVGAVVLGVIKETHGRDLIVLNPRFVIGQVICYAVLLLVLTVVFAAWTWRVVDSRRRGMVWTLRRRKAKRTALLRAIVIFIIVGGQLFLNVHLAVDPGSFCTSFALQPIVNAFVWVSWNTLLCMLVIDAHNMNLLKLKHRSDGMVRDKPFWCHWPKLFLWIPSTAMTLWVTAMGVEDGHTITTTVNEGGSCTWGAALDCRVSAPLFTATVIDVAVFATYFVLYTYYLWRAWRQLSRELYQKYRMMNTILRLQLRFSNYMVVALLIGIILTWYVGSDACVNYALTWYGNPPVTFVIVALQMVSFSISFPRRHNAISTEHVLPTTLLQQFAWTEADVPRKLAARSAAVDSTCAVCSDFLAKPLFCLETAIKLFFWSVLVYSYTETTGVTLETMPGPIKALIGEMDAAMRLFNLSKRHLFYDRSLGTKVLVAWNSSTIVVTVRGTAEVANFLQDAKFLQTAHPPKRKFKGRTPRVHQGFLATWQANGIRTRVLAHIAALLDSAEDRGAVRVLCTGHSLGGAVAQLASFDIVRELGVEPHNVQVYTYGCPRLGNHALAEECDTTVPHTWHVINDQDVVTRGMKLMGLYKRAGQRVIVNCHGDLIVRPNLFELSMLQNVRGGETAHHMTVAYQTALIAVVSSQLKASSRHDDGLHGLLGLLKEMPEVRAALEVHAKQLGTSLVDLVRNVATHPDTFRSATFSSSQRFTPSRHASLLRIAGGTPPAVAAGSEPRSPMSDTSDQALPVAMLERFSDTGDAPSMKLPDDSFEAGRDTASVPADAALSDATAAVRQLQRWRSAANKARAAVRLGVGGGLRAPALDAAARAAAADTGREPCSKYCHTIPEQPSSGDARGGRSAAGSHEGHMGCGDRWRCPLSCRPEELPEGAELHGCLLNMGEAPDMKSCKSTWADGGTYWSPAAASSEDGGPGLPEAMPRAPPALTEATVRVPLGFAAGMDAVSGDAHAHLQRDAPRSSVRGEGLQLDELAEAARNAGVPDAAPDSMPWCTSGGRISIVECREENSSEGSGASTSAEDVCVVAVASTSEE